MTRLPSRLALLVLAGGLALAGCNDKATRPTSASTSSTGTATTSSTTTTRGAPASTRTVAKPKATGAEPLPDQTGIPACDNYLATYIACHQAASIYPPDQIEGRYEAMRESLLRDSLNPDIRPQLGNRCTSLANTLHQALHGKSCATAPAAPASGTTR